MSDIPAVLEREVRRHLPKGYVVQAGREEAHAGYAVNVWRKDQERVQGPEEVVCRCHIGGPHEEYSEVPSQLGTSLGWRIVLLTRLHEDLERRRPPPIDDRTGEPLQRLNVEGPPVYWRPSKPRRSFLNANWSRYW